MHNSPVRASYGMYIVTIVIVTQLTWVYYYKSGHAITRCYSI